MIAAGQAHGSTDGVLARQITHQLAETNRPSLKRLSVDVRGSNVTLSGQVESFHEKQIAIQACRALAGIALVADAVEVAAFS